MEISKFAVITAMLFTVCVTVASAASSGNTIVITNADNGKQISVPLSGSFEIQLQQAGATGYSWEIVSLDKNYLELLKSETAVPEYDRPIVGGPVVKKWSIRAAAKGKTEVKAALYRPWEGVEKAVENFTVHINIK